ncbi:hypothetical protein B5S25_05725 [Paenibacillus larvae subsp. pulvifaciens]|nr:hypothetical protein B5S25_05725 [Paenibacillus larvae subsp. pulvifaciens]
MPQRFKQGDLTAIFAGFRSIMTLCPVEKTYIIQSFKYISRISIVKRGNHLIGVNFAGYT